MVPFLASFCSNLTFFQTASCKTALYTGQSQIHSSSSTFQFNVLFAIYCYFPSQRTKISLSLWAVIKSYTDYAFNTDENKDVQKTLILIEDSLKKIVYPCEKFGKNSGFESNQFRLTKTTKIAIGTVFPSPFSRTGTTFANFCFGQHLFLFVSAQHVKYQY